MAFKIQCPDCQAKLKLAEPPAKDIKLKCPKCEKTISIKAAPKPEEKEESAAKPSAAAAPAGKAASKAKAASKPTKPKAKSKKKAKAKPAPVQDEWDDYEDLDGDFDDFDDGYDDYEDDYDEPRPTRSKKRQGGGAKGKSKGKAAAAKSGSKKGLMIGLGILLGVGAIGGGVYAFMASGDGDSDAVASGGGSSDGGSTPSEAATSSDATADTSTPKPKVDARGQNFVSLQYIPENADAVVYVKVSELMESALLDQFKDAIPTPLQNSAALQPKAIESVVVAFWSPEDSQAQGAVRNDDVIVPAVAQMNQGFGPPGRNAQFGGPGMMAQPAGSYLYIARTFEDIKPSDMGEVKGSSTHNGQEIFDVQIPDGPPQGQAVWMPDGRTVVGGPPELVKKAIDQGSSEYRFERFDFAKSSSSNVILAFAPHDPGMMAQAPPLPPGQLSINLAEDLKAVCVQVAITDALKIDAHVVCKNSEAASKLQQDVSGKIDEGKLKLDEQIKSMGAFGIPLVPIQKILGRVKATTSSDRVVINADATNEEITALSKTAGPLIAMMGGGMGQEGGPPGFGPAGFGPPGMGGGSMKDEKPFTEEPTAADKEYGFEQDIAPIIKWRCRSCHVDKAEGGLSLRSYETLMAHSSGSGKAVTPNDPEASSFFTTARDAPAPHPKLKADELASIKAWIESGAKP